MRVSTDRRGGLGEHNANRCDAPLLLGVLRDQPAREVGCCTLKSLHAPVMNFTLTEDPVVPILLSWLCSDTTGRSARETGKEHASTVAPLCAAM